MRIPFRSLGFWVGLAALCPALAQTVSPPRLAGISGAGSVELGQRVVMSPTVFAGSPTTGLQFQWRKSGADLPGQTANTLVIDPVAASDAGTYTVAASNSAGSSVASTELTVKPAAAPVITTPPRAQTADVGQTVVFAFVASGSFPRTYQWKKDGADLPGATNSTLLRGPLTSADVGVYAVQITNAYGSVVSASASLTVNAARPPVIGDFSPTTQTIPQGRALTVSAPVSSGSAPFTYQWRKGGVPIAGMTDSALTLDGAALSDGGRYSVTVTNIAGSATSGDVEIVIEPTPPPYKGRLRNQSMPAGLPVTLQDNVLVDYQPTTFQWYKDGKPVPDATRSSYTIDHATIESAGAYFVVATNVAGSTTSDTAIVSVTAADAPVARDWLVSERGGDVVYFAFANPARIERFNLAADAWLSPIMLPRTPTAFTVSGNALYVAFGPVLSRFNLDGSGETSVTPGFANDITGLRGAGDFLLVSERGSVTSVRLSDGAKVGTTAYSNDLHGPLVFSSGTRLVYGRSSDYSGYLRVMTLRADGSFAYPGFGSDADSVPPGERFFVVPNETYVAGTGGVVYRAANLNFVAGLGGTFDDLDFTATGNAVVLRGANVHTFDSQFKETGRLSAAFAAKRLAVRGNDAFVFGRPDNTGAIPKARLSLTQAQAAAVATPLDPAGLGFTPDAVLLDRDAVVLLYSKVNRQVFRWSTTERRFLSSIPLSGWPNAIGYSTFSHRLYLGYSDGRVTQVKLDAGSLTEEPFVTALEHVFAIVSVGQQLFVGSMPSTVTYPTVPFYFLYTPDGQFTTTRGSYSANYTWSPANRRLYSFRDDTSPNDLIYIDIKADGTFGQRGDSPYHGEVQALYPIRVSPDASSVLIGSGKFYDGTTLRQSNSLPQRIDEAEWLGSRPVTVRTTVRGLELERWGGANFSLDRSALLTGRIMRLLALPGNRLLVVTVDGGLVHFTILDENFAVLSHDFVSPPNRLANLSTRALVGRGDQLLIPGFVISGTDPKTVLVRATGPTLTALGVPGALSDPTFSIYNSAGTVVASNDNWSSAANLSFLAQVTSRVGAFTLPRNSRDAAALVTLVPGAYTVQVRGVGDTTGVALVEVYDAQDNVGAGRLINIATRAVVGTGSDILITGIVVQSDTLRTVLVRATGPALAAFGVSGTLANPKLRVFKESQLIGENDDWGEGGVTASNRIAEASVGAGAFPLPAGSRDAALLLTLPGGNYSVQVSGADGGTGVALIEVYEVSGPIFGSN